MNVEQLDRTWGSAAICTVNLLLEKVFVSLWVYFLKQEQPCFQVRHAPSMHTSCVGLSRTMQNPVSNRIQASWGQGVLHHWEIEFSWSLFTHSRHQGCIGHWLDDPTHFSPQEQCLEDSEEDRAYNKSLLLQKFRSSCCKVTAGTGGRAALLSDPELH